MDEVEVVTTNAEALSVPCCLRKPGVFHLPSRMVNSNSEMQQQMMPEQREAEAQGWLLPGLPSAVVLPVKWIEPRLCMQLGS